jgi:threonine dehydratase
MREPSSEPASGTLPTREDVEATARLLSGRVLRTPLVESFVLNERIGARVLLKLESLQHTNSFKFRGAMSRLLRLSPTQRAAGVVAWSSGNHAQGVAAAGKVLGIAVTIVMPADAPAVKRRRTEALGARVVSYDRRRENREAIGRAIAREQGSVIVPPYDDRWVMAGQGTVAVEALQQADEAGAVVQDLLIPCGGGGLTAGCALACEGASSPVRVWTVEPAHYDDHARSFVSGDRQRADTSQPSLCDALLAPEPGELTFAVNRSRAAGGRVVDDHAVRLALRFGFEELRLVIEPGGAVALASLLAAPHDFRGRCVIALISGGNVDPALFADVVQATL